jgi:translation elongation factor EF-4
VQAQTVANHNAAKEAGLKIIPVLTKIDLPTADPEPALAALEAAFGFSPDEAIWTSAKSGAGIPDLFPAILSRLPPPIASRKSPLRCLLFDSWFDEHRGVICCVQVVDGTLKVGDVIVAAHSGDKFTVQEVGLMAPQKVPVSHLAAGHIGYVICGMKNVKQAILGDTFFSQSDYMSLGRQLLPVLKGFKPAKPMVFASLYPVDSGDFSALLTATERLTLNDASVSVEKESSSSLGFGLRCGFLGLLHMDVFNQRLQDEFKTDVIITAPMVAYKVLLKNGKEVTVERPADFPPSQDVEAYYEPTAHVSIMAPGEFLSPLLGLLTDRRGVQEDIIFLNNAENGKNQIEAAKALLAALPSSKAGDEKKISEEERDFTTNQKNDAESDKFAAGNDAQDSSGSIIEIKDEEVEDEDETEEEEEEVSEPVILRSSSTAPSSRHHQLALSQDRVVLKFIMPWAEVVSHLADSVKSMTAGYASLDWMPGAYKKSDIVKVDMLMNSKPVDALSFIAHRDKALSEARRVALKLKGAISRQMFEINIQAAIGSKIVAKERIPPFRKDVLIKSGKTVGGGDKSRKEKLLSKQREGKRRMKTVGNVELPQAAFLSIMSTEK